MLLLQRRDEAGRSFETAVALQPDYAEAWSNLAANQAAQGHHETALANYERALALGPAVPETHRRQADLLRALGRPDEALAAYERATMLRPAYLEAHMARGELLMARARHEDALQCFHVVLALDPDNRQAHFVRGLVLRQLENHPAALFSFDKVIALKDDDVDAHIMRGQTLYALEQFEAAAEAYERALALQPDHVDAHVGRGVTMKQLRRFDEACTSLARVIALRPEDPDGYLNLGNVRQDMGDMQGALASYATVIALRPDDPVAYSNRGNLYEEMRQCDAALRDFDKAIELKPDFIPALWNKALAYLRQGQFEAGWQGYEWRWKAEHLALFRENRNFAEPLWLGQQDLAGKTILLHAEQGLGDTLQFCRYAPLVAARGARVVLEVQRPLVKLMQTLAGPAQVLAKGEELPPFDFHCPLMSLPLAFKTTLATVPAPLSYLASEPAREQAWAGLLGPAARPRVGVAWSGNAVHKNDHNRSIAFDSFAQLLTPACEFVSLQKEYRDGDAGALAASPVRDVSARLDDFSDTAALCAAMDVVVAVDTSIAHLAGALGKPVWILLPETSDWRWLLERSDCPWYPGARLYRQQAGEDWSAVLARVRADLDALAGTHASSRP
jgi:tetratricopeptide (TPR) repeat protein